MHAGHGIEKWIRVRYCKDQVVQELGARLGYELCKIWIGIRCKVRILIRIGIELCKIRIGVRCKVRYCTGLGLDCARLGLELRYCAGLGLDCT